VTWLLFWSSPPWFDCHYKPHVLTKVNHLSLFIHHHHHHHHLSVYKDSTKRVRRFITHQRDRATKKWLDPNNQSTLTESYPTLSILSPELQRVCALHLTHSLLETIPYLSTKYLSPEEQAKVAMECISLEFTAGEKFREHSELGRGVLIFRQGFGVSSRNSKRKSVTLRRDLRDKPIDVDDILVDDDYQREHQLVYHFVGYTKVLFVPRSAIMDVFANNERVWKECARWRYFMAMFVLYSLKESEKSVEDCI